MFSVVRKFDHPNPQGVAAWLAEVDRLIWSDCAQAQRVAGAETEYASGRIDPAPSLSQRRTGLARAESEIAKARALAAFIVDPDKRARARKAINKMARAVRAERGV